MGEISHEGGVSWDKVPEPTDAEMAAFKNPAAHTAMAQRPDQQGGNEHVRRLEAQFADEEPLEELPAEEDARGPQWGEGSAAGEVAEAPEAEVKQEVAAFDPTAWDTGRLWAAPDEGLAEVLAEVPEVHRPLVERVVSAARAREAEARSTYERAAAAREAAAREGVSEVVGALTKLRDEKLLPLAQRLENIGVADAQTVLDEFTALVNETAARSERESALEREVMLYKWDAFTREEPQAKVLLAEAGRADQRRAAIPEGQPKPPLSMAEKALATWREHANKGLSFSDAWALTVRRFPDVANLGKPAAPKPPPVQPQAQPQAQARLAAASPRPAPAVARQPVAPPAPPQGRMEPRSAAPPSSRSVRPLSTPASEREEMDRLLDEGWSAHLTTRGMR